MELALPEINTRPPATMRTIAATLTGFTSALPHDKLIDDTHDALSVAGNLVICPPLLREIAKLRTVVYPMETEQALCRPIVERQFEISVAFLQERGDISRECGKVRPSPALEHVKGRISDRILARALLNTKLMSSSGPERPVGIPGSCVGLVVFRRRAMLYTLAVVLLILWLLGFVSGYTIGAFIHVLLVVAIVLLLVGLLSGRRVV
jgi:hypothetical protein